MKKILILFAHPRFEQSRANHHLIHALKGMDEVTFHDLYEQYPDFNVDVNREKDLLKRHEIIVWQHPFYWYSCPPLLKQWIDMVLEFGWAYGPNADALHGKQVFNVITTGGAREVYCEEGRNNYTVKEFLRPFEQTARLCGMDYLPPFAVMGTHKLKQEDFLSYAKQYQNLLNRLQQDEMFFSEGKKCEFVNDLLE
ncbi:MAG: NAD(P)H-dependent oxidoreductase [Bacteroidota bacterium]